MASHSLASLPTSGLYGASGWIEDNGILQLMRPYVDSPSICADFARFSGVNAHFSPLITLQIVKTMHRRSICSLRQHSPIRMYSSEVIWFFLRDGMNE